MKRIFLVGYMGTGKSTVGKQLARELGLRFIDLDQFISESERQSVAELFRSQGESGFRGLERKYLRKLDDSTEPFVCATGGGTPCFYDNMHWMNAAGVTVYLEMDVASLAYRLRHAKTERPILKAIEDPNLEAFISQHLEERRADYEEAQIRFPALGFDKRKLKLLLAEIERAETKRGA